MQKILDAIKVAHFAEKLQQKTHTVPDDVFYYRHELRFKMNRGNDSGRCLSDQQYHGSYHE